jgi:hypothetical protein
MCPIIAFMDFLKYTHGVGWYTLLTDNETIKMYAHNILREIRRHAVVITTLFINQYIAIEMI